MVVNQTDPATICPDCRLYTAKYNPETKRWECTNPHCHWKDR